MDAIFQGIPYIAMCSVWLLRFYLLKLHENVILAFLNCVLYNLFYIFKQAYMERGVKIELFTHISLVIKMWGSYNWVMRWQNNEIKSSQSWCRKQNPFSVHIGLNIAHRNFHSKTRDQAEDIYETDINL